MWGQKRIFETQITLDYRVATYKVILQLQCNFSWGMICSLKLSEEIVHLAVSLISSWVSVSQYRCSSKVEKFGYFYDRKNFG